MMIVALVVFFVLPTVPVTVRVRVPVLARFVTATLKVPVPPGVTELGGVMLGVTPVVPPLALRVTALVNVPIALTWIV